MLGFRVRGGRFKGDVRVQGERGGKFKGDVWVRVQGERGKV